MKTKIICDTNYTSDNYHNIILKYSTRLTSVQSKKGVVKMNKTKITLPLKGLHPPRILLWFRGFIHGKVIHTGGLDVETNTISSGYITGQIKRFRNACIDCCENTEEKLKKEWQEADCLLIDLSNIASVLSDDSNYHKFSGESNAELRANEKKDTLLASYKAQHLAKIKSLADIANTIQTEICQSQNKIVATAELLLSTFSCYGHGLIMKPVRLYNKCWGKKK